MQFFCMCKSFFALFLKSSYSEKAVEEGFGVQGDQGVEVAFAGEGAVEGEEKQIDYEGGDETPDIENIGQCQQQNTAEFQAVAEFVVRLGVVCDRDESHIEDCLHACPTRIDGKFTQGDCADYAQRCCERVRSVECGKAKSVYADFHQYELPEYGYVLRFG